jgi:tetratricopeptide (TPR) repeat protein
MRISSSNRRAAATASLALLVALASLAAGCRRGGPQANANASAQADAAQVGAAVPGGAKTADMNQLNAEVERLERQAERNPADDEMSDELARAYVRRGDALRGAGQLRESLTDYQNALRADPDNAEAQKNAAEVTELLGGEQKEDENGAPAPLPITPNVADEEGKPTPTPKKSDK